MAAENRSHTHRAQQHAVDGGGGVLGRVQQHLEQRVLAERAGLHGRQLSRWSWADEGARHRQSVAAVGGGERGGNQTAG